MVITPIEYFQLKSAYHSARIEGNTQSWRSVLKDFEKRKKESLVPRRGKIFKYISVKKLVSSAEITKKFSEVNGRTLRYHLKKLQDAGFIHKLGTTRGVYYETNEKS